MTPDMGRARLGLGAALAQFGRGCPLLIATDEGRPNGGPRPTLGVYELTMPVSSRTDWFAWPWHS